MLKLANVPRPKRPSNSKPHPCSPRRKAGGRTNALMHMRTNAALIAKAMLMEGEEAQATVNLCIERYDFWKRDAKRRRAYILMKPIQKYCQECGIRQSLTAMVCSTSNTEVAAIYCEWCAKRRKLIYWTRDLPTNRINEFDFYI